MLKIGRSEEEGKATFALSGQIEEKHVRELLELLNKEARPTEVTLDLTEVKLVHREAIRFLAACEVRGIQLTGCPSYIRRWIERDNDNAKDNDVERF